MQRNIYGRNFLSSGRGNKYLQAVNMRTLEYQQLAVFCIQFSISRILRTCGDRKFRLFFFIKILQESKSFRKSYKDYVIEKFKLLINKKTKSQNLLT